MQKIARKRRTSGTRAELRLAGILAELQVKNPQVQFQREWVFGGRYIADFFFHEVRLAVEVDGSIHSRRDQMVRDRLKERVLQGMDVTLVRLTNADVFGPEERLLEKLRAGWRAARDGKRGLVGGHS